MSNKSYIPRSDKDFLVWSKNLVGYAMANFARWGVIDPKDMLEIPLEDFENKLTNANLPNAGSIDKKLKSEARQILERAERAYVQGFLARNPKISLEDRSYLNLPTYDRTPTVVADPTGQAIVKISFPARTQLSVQIVPVGEIQQDARAHYGCRVYYGVYAAGDQPPADGRDLRESVFTRKKKELFTFMPSDSGKTAWFCVRYENSKGKAGPWGAMDSAIIP